MRIGVREFVLGKKIKYSQAEQDELRGKDGIWVLAEDVFFPLWRRVWHRLTGKSSRLNYWFPVFLEYEERTE